MTRLTWDKVGERRYETGVDRGVLFQRDASGNFVDGVAWNGLTTVTESPSGAEPNPQYADNIKYLNLLSAEELGGTIEAFTYPDEFAQNDGTIELSGVSVGQQRRRTFGLAFRSRVGNDIDGTDAGYKLHLVYGAQAAPSEKAYATINDSPEAIPFSWEFSTTPVEVGRNDENGNPLKPTALLVIDSTKAEPTRLATLENMLFGDADSDPVLPLPGEVIDILDGAGVTEVRLTGANAPTYNAATHVVTLPNVAGVQWIYDGEEVAPGAQPALAFGEKVEVTARPTADHTITSDADWTYDY